MSTCSGCGFTYGELPRHLLATKLRESGHAYGSRLDPDRDALRARPARETWSPLEYACHARDVVLMQRDRLYVALVEDEPSFKPMYRDERVAFDRYNTQVPAVVAEQVSMAAGMLAHAFAGLGDDQWARSLVYGFPSPLRRDVEWVAHHSLHEIIHHLADIDAILGAA